MLCYLIYIVIWDVVLMPYAQGALFNLAITLAFGQVAWHYTLIRSRSRDGCFKAFRLNHWLGFTLFVALAASYAIR